MTEHWIWQHITVQSG